MTHCILPKRKILFVLKWQLIGCSSSVVYRFHCPGEFGFGVWNDIFSLQKRFCTVYSCEAVIEKALHPEVLHILPDIHHDRENWFPQCVELPSFWKVHCHKWPWHWYYAHGALCPNKLSVRKEVCDGPHMGYSHPPILRVQWWTPSALALEVCVSWWKGGSIRFVVPLDEHYYLNLQTHSHHSHHGSIWEVLWKDDLVGVSPHSTGSLYGPLILYLIRPRMTGRKGSGLTWTILLAKIFHPLSPQVNLQEMDSREIEGGQRGEWER